MKPEMLVAICVGLMTSAIIFGIGAIIILSVPQLADNAKYLLPAIVVSGCILAPFIVWRISPRIRLPY